MLCNFPSMTARSGAASASAFPGVQFWSHDIGGYRAYQPRALHPLGPVGLC